MDRNFLSSGNNAAFIDALYQSYLSDPGSVDPSWAAFFSEFDRAPNASSRAASTSVDEDDELGRIEEAIGRMIQNFRLRGHLAAKLDPLGLSVTSSNTLQPSYYGISDTDLPREVHAGSLFIE